MNVEATSVEARAAVHRALGDPHRVAIVDALQLSDRTPGELRALTGMNWNLLAFHLRVLEDAGVVERRVSEGDRRRRYACLRDGVPGRLAPRGPAFAAGAVLFVCTHNSARSQFAAGLWRHRVGTTAMSAGTDPAPAVHPLAVATARAYGIDLSAARPRGYAAVREQPDLVVSVCDRAGEGHVPFDVPRLHWSVPDPVAGGRRTFEAAFAAIAARLERLAARAAA